MLRQWLRDVLVSVEWQGPSHQPAMAWVHPASSLALQSLPWMLRAANSSQTTKLLTSYYKAHLVCLFVCLSYPAGAFCVARSWTLTAAFSPWPLDMHAHTSPHGQPEGGGLSCQVMEWIENFSIYNNSEGQCLRCLVLLSCHCENSSDSFDEGGMSGGQLPTFRSLHQSSPPVSYTHLTLPTNREV